MANKMSRDMSVKIVCSDFGISKNSEQNFVRLKNNLKVFKVILNDYYLSNGGESIGLNKQHVILDLFGAVIVAEAGRIIMEFLHANRCVILEKRGKMI